MTEFTCTVDESRKEEIDKRMKDYIENNKLIGELLDKIFYDDFMKPEEKLVCAFMAGETCGERFMFDAMMKGMVGNGKVE